mgnify:CR=1 FL=1
MRTLSAKIQTAITNLSVNVWEFVRADFGGPHIFYWCDADWTSAEGFAGHAYESRIKRPGKLPYTVGVKGNKTTLQIANDDKFVTNLANQGVVWEAGEISIVRAFVFSDGLPESANTFDLPTWRGRVVKPPTFEEWSTLTLSSGIRELTREALRRYTHSDDVSFDDADHFPYDPLGGVGLPRMKLNEVATGGSSATIVDTSVNFTTRQVQAGWLVFVEDTKAVGVIKTVENHTLTVDKWLQGTAPSGGERYIVGPAATSYNHSKSDSIALGMFGINDRQTAANLPSNSRRYFYGLTQPAGVVFENNRQVISLAGARHDELGPVQGIDGRVIPVFFGTVRARALDVLGWGTGEDERFLHTLVCVGEGRVQDIRSPTIDRYPPDDIDRAPSLSVQQAESLMLWGTDGHNLGGNDQDAVGVDLTQDQQKQAIGSRESVAVKKRTTLDTYSENPFLWNNTAGEGSAYGGLALFYQRVDMGVGNVRSDQNPSAEATILGNLVKMAPGSTAQADDGDATDWTWRPNPVQVWYWFAINKRWGAKLDPGRINETKVVAESDHCQESITATQPLHAPISSTVTEGPEESYRTMPTGGKNWIRIPNGLLQGADASGGILTITTSGGTVTRTIAYVRVIESSGEFAPDITEDSSLYWTDPANIGDRHTFIVVTGGDFATGSFMPTSGDTFKITFADQVRRYKANGALRKEASVGETMLSILRNCGGTVVQQNGTLAPVIPRAVDYTVVDQRTMIADYGPTPNVIGRIVYKPADRAKVPTAVYVKFLDLTAGYKPRTIIIRSEYAENRVAAIRGEDSKEKRIPTLTLGLTTTPDQAIRVGSIWLRRRTYLERIPSYEPGQFVFTMALPDALEYELVEDVLPIAGEFLPDWCQFCRIMDLDDNPDRATITVKAEPHFNFIYDDVGYDVGTDHQPEIAKRDELDPPEGVVIESLTESQVTGLEGVDHVRIDGVQTLPTV